MRLLSSPWALYQFFSSSSRQDILLSPTSLSSELQQGVLALSVSSSPSFPYLDPPSYCYHLLLTRCCGPLSTRDLRGLLDTLARIVAAFFATVGGTSFTAPAVDLLYPFAPSPAGSAPTTVCSTNIVSFTPNLGVVMGHYKQERMSLLMALLIDFDRDTAQLLHSCREDWMELRLGSAWHEEGSKIWDTEIL